MAIRTHSIGPQRSSQIDGKMKWIELEINFFLIAKCHRPTDQPTDHSFAMHSIGLLSLACLTSVFLCTYQFEVFEWFSNKTSLKRWRCVGSNDASCAFHCDICIRCVWYVLNAWVNRIALHWVKIQWVIYYTRRMSYSWSLIFVYQRSFSADSHRVSILLRFRRLSSLSKRNCAPLRFDQHIQFMFFYWFGLVCYCI